MLDFFSEEKATEQRVVMTIVKKRKDGKVVAAVNNERVLIDKDISIGEKVIIFKGNFESIVPSKVEKIRI